MPSRPQLAAIAHHRRKLVLGARGSDTFSTFISADYTPPADGTTDTTLTFTLKDSADAAVADTPVTFAVLDRRTISASLSSVSVAPSTIENDGVDEAIVTITLVDTDAQPFVNIQTGTLITCTSTGTGNTITRVSGLTDGQGRIFFTFASTVGESKTITGVAGGLTITDTATLTVSGVTPLVLEDFSTYTSTADLLADPRGIYNNVESSNTSRIALDTSVGYGTSSQSMRYTWPNNGSASLDYAIRPGVLTIAGGLTEVWVEYVVRFKSNFKVQSGGSAAAEYKMAAAGDLAGTGRWNIPEMQAGQWVLGYPDTVGGVTATPIPSTLWDDNPHVYRVHMRLSPSGSTGILRFAVDGVTQTNQTGFNTAGGHTDIDYFSPGLNLNQGPNIDDMSLWWHRIAIYSSDPGWTF